SASLILRKVASSEREALIVLRPAPPLPACKAPALVEPHPLAGVFADPFLDNVVEKLSRRGDVDFTVFTTRQFERFMDLQPIAVAGEANAACRMQRTVETVR